MEWYYYIIPLLCLGALLFIAYRIWSQLKKPDAGYSIAISPIWKVGLLAIVSGLIGTTFRLSWAVNHMRDEYEKKPGVHDSFHVPDSVTQQFQNALIPATIGLVVLLLSLVLWALMKRKIREV